MTFFSFFFIFAFDSNFAHCIFFLSKSNGLTLYTLYTRRFSSGTRSWSKSGLAGDRLTTGEAAKRGNKKCLK